MIGLRLPHKRRNRCCGIAARNRERYRLRVVMLARLERTVRERGLLDGGDRVLVAVSGGPDSMALLHGLAVLAPRLSITLEVATIDHGLRPEAAGEAAWVAERARALGLPHTTAVLALGGGSGRVGQEAARRARLAALEGIAQGRGCGRIALGHHADDQAETVLFRILRGTGVGGLRGIPYRRGPFVRPLLDVRRVEIIRFLKRRQIAFIEDPSNANRRFARSRLRHDVLPALAVENPRIVDALLGLAADAARHLGEGSAVDGVVRKAAAAGIPLSERAATAVRRAITDRAGTRRFDLTGGDVEVRYGVPVFRTHAPGGGSASPSHDEIEIAAPGIHRLSDGTSVEITRVDCLPSASQGDAAFDAERLCWPLRMRHIRPGDRMLPRRGRGRRKLQDLLVDAKIPRPDRPWLPVVTDSVGCVLMVPGLRPADTAAPTTSTRRWLVVRHRGI